MVKSFKFENFFLNIILSYCWFLLLLLLKHELEYDSEKSKIHIPDSLQNWLIDDLDFILEQNKVNF